MQRRERNDLLQAGPQRRVEDCRLYMARPAVNDAVPDDIDARDIVAEQLEPERERRRVICALRRALERRLEPRLTRA